MKSDILFWNTVTANACFKLLELMKKIWVIKVRFITFRNESIPNNYVDQSSSIIIASLCKSFFKFSYTSIITNNWFYTYR